MIIFVKKFPSDGRTLFFSQSSAQRADRDLRKQEINRDETDQVPSSIPTERSGIRERATEGRPSEREDAVEEPADGDGVGHADVAYVEGEGLR